MVNEEGIMVEDKRLYIKNGRIREGCVKVENILLTTSSPQVAIRLICNHMPYVSRLSGFVKFWGFKISQRRLVSLSCYSSISNGVGRSPVLDRDHGVPRRLYVEE